MSTLTPLTTYAICNIMDIITKDEIQNSIIRIATKIPPSDKLKNKEKYVDIDHKMQDVDYLNYMKTRYLDVCCWLIKEIEDLINIMVSEKKNEIMVDHDLDTGYDDIQGLALTTNPDVNTNIGGIPKAWMKMDYDMPFHHIKNIMEDKGYIINTYSNKTHPQKVENRKIYNPSIDYHYKPVETYKLEIKIKDINNEKNINNKRKRNRGCDDDDECEK